MPRSLFVLVALSLALSACGNDATGDGQTADAATTQASVRTSPSQTSALICLKTEALQTAGGEGLASMDQTQEGDPNGAPITGARLRSVFRGAFAPSLNGQLNQLVRAANDRRAARRVKDAALNDLQTVEADPPLLLKDRALGRTFSDAQAVAHHEGFSEPDCR